MTKRSIIIALVIAIIFSVFIASITANFNGFLIILPIFTYFYNILFIEIDEYYYSIKKQKREYHFYSMSASVFVLIFQIIMYRLIYIKGKFENGYDLYGFLIIQAICVLVVIICTFLKDKSLENDIPDDWK